ncbi:uncharacterized protein LOC127873593 isoform X1 [Dreissena polymorpha]|uniref:THAP-type domain-containing protein n=1 Tax=Dreissena polymorpha TaxID=45954 RepID=A0A9D4KUV2_DREPO|nr:uncharacterized protein LOC127873593 isoform X1 [Dreissena polymorpha]KAH3846034.1 hypothetical protein DPMN_088328 [Dreissena polymorpha]
MVKRCQWGLCNSDSRYPARLVGGIEFIPFPKPKRDYDKCKRWIKACGRPHEQLNVNTVNDNYNMFVCSKHFKEGKPTAQFPDPLPAVTLGHRLTKVKQPLKKISVTNPAPRKKLRNLENDTILSEKNENAEHAQHSHHAGIHNNDKKDKPATLYDQLNQDWAPTVNMGRVITLQSAFPTKSSHPCRETVSAEKSDLRWYFKRTMNNLCQKLLKLGEQCIVVTVNPGNGFVGHMGTQLGREFIEENSHILYDFLDYCKEALADREPSVDSSDSETDSDIEFHNTFEAVGTMETSQSPFHDSCADILQEPDKDQLPIKLYISAQSGQVGPILQQKVVGKSKPTNLDGTCSVEKVGRKPVYEIDNGVVKDVTEQLDYTCSSKTSTFEETSTSKECIENLMKLEEDSRTCISTKVFKRKTDNYLCNVDLFSERTQTSDITPSVEIKTEADEKVIIQNGRKKSQQALRQFFKRTEMNSKRKRKFDNEDLTETDEVGDDNEEAEEIQSGMDDNDMDYKPDWDNNTSALPVCDAPIQTRSRKSC